MKAKIKSKVFCLLWCIQNGITKPHKYFFSRWGGSQAGKHNYFSYDKFKRCGKVYRCEKTISPKDTYECSGYHFHQDLVKIA